MPPVEAAESARLRHSRDDAPGIRRRAKAFVYFRPSGGRVREAELLRCIKALAVPPAWRDVWICPDPLGHLQATGARSARPQAIPLPSALAPGAGCDEVRAMRVFGCVLPRIRKRSEHDLRRPGLPREKVLAAVVRLMERTLARVGNAEYAARTRASVSPPCRTGMCASAAAGSNSISALIVASVITAWLAAYHRIVYAGEDTAESTEAEARWSAGRIATGFWCCRTGLAADPSLTKGGSLRPGSAD